MDNYPPDLAPDFEPSGAVATPFEEWWLGVQPNFPYVPEEVARDWLHRHWSHSPFGWLPSTEYRFSLSHWPSDRINQIRTGWSDFSADPAPAIEHGRYLVEDHRKRFGRNGLIDFMVKHGTFPVPPIVLDNLDGHLNDRPEARIPYPANFLLVEGHRRFNIATYLAEISFLQPELPFWIMKRD